MAKEKKIKPRNWKTDKYGNNVFANKRDWFKRVKMPLYFDFLRWVLIDWYRGKTKKNFGIYAFVGEFGEGKTISMVKYAMDIKEQYPEIQIASSFTFSLADKRVETIQDLYDLEGQWIVLMTEFHLSFNSKKWQDMPMKFLGELCQCRKRKLMLLMDMQVFEECNKSIRGITKYVVECSNFWGLDRLFINRYFKKSIYEKWKKAEGNSQRRSKINPWMVKQYVADDDLYSLYDTEEIAKSLTEVEPTEEMLYNLIAQGKPATRK